MSFNLAFDDLGTSINSKTAIYWSGFSGAEKIVVQNKNFEICKKQNLWKFLRPIKQNVQSLHKGEYCEMCDFNGEDCATSSKIPYRTNLSKCS